MTNCRKQLLNGTELLPTHAVGRKEWNKLFVACSNITINEEMNSILASDCVNGTWFENLGEIDYNILTKKYEEYRYDRDKRFHESCHFDLIPCSDLTKEDGSKEMCRIATLCLGSKIWSYFKRQES